MPSSNIKSANADLFESDYKCEGRYLYPAPKGKIITLYANINLASEMYEGKDIIQVLSTRVEMSTVDEERAAFDLKGTYVSRSMDENGVKEFNSETAEKYEKRKTTLRWLHADNFEYLPQFEFLVEGIEGKTTVNCLDNRKY